MDLPGLPGFEFIPSDPGDALITDIEILTQLLAKHQRKDPGGEFVLLVKLTNEQYGSKVPSDIFDFPRTEADGVVLTLCQVGAQLVANQQAVAYRVAARRGANQWEVFGIIPAPDGRQIMLNKRISWNDDHDAQRLRLIEALLPELRANAHITDEERALGVSPQQAAARQNLSATLRELADRYKETGQQLRVDEIWEELGPLLTETLRVRYK